MRWVAGAVRDGSGRSIERLRDTPLVGAPTTDGFAARGGVIIRLEERVENLEADLATATDRLETVRTQRRE
jgi:hypothetical protein